MPFGEIYLPLYVGFARDPKIRDLMYQHGQDGILAAYLYIVMALYCRENLSDGWVPRAEVPAMAYPMDRETAERVVEMLLSARLISARARSNADALHIPAYVPRNGTRQDALRRSDQHRDAARSRWRKHGASDAHSDRTYETDASAVRSLTQSETESIKESSAGVDDPRAPAPPRARDDDRSNGIENRDDDDLDGRIVIMLAAHGFSVNREQARGVRLRIIGGRKVDNPARYVSAALATADGARKWAPTPAVMPPRGLDPVTARRAAQIRAADAGQDTLDHAEIADRAHRGADAARKLLADRPRADVAAAAALPRQLHGPALAAAQLAESRASRPAPPPALDDEQDQDDDDEIWEDHDDQDPDELDPSDFEEEPDEPERGEETVELPDYDDEPPF